MTGLQPGPVQPVPDQRGPDQRGPDQRGPDQPAGAGLEPGQFVRHPQQADWGRGQVQSAVGDRVTVTFEHAGKILVNTAIVTLLPADPGP